MPQTEIPARILRKRKFIFTLGYPNSPEIAFDIEIPIPPFTDFTTLFGNLVHKTNLPYACFDAARSQLQEFILKETRSYEDDIADSSVLDFLHEDGPSSEFDYDQKFRMDSGMTPDVTPHFDEDFKELMKVGRTEELLKLIRLESEMNFSLAQKLEQRDAELKKLRAECEDAVERTKETSDLEEHSYNLSVLNDKLQLTEANYCNQIKALTERNRSEFIRAVGILKENGNLPNENCNKKSVPLNKPKFVEHPPVLDESFTIYIGNQLKSMHNARLLQYRSLDEFCHDRSMESMDRTVYESSRLNSLINLYRRDLKAAVMLVDRDPLYHMHTQTEFFKLCEKSVELHFDPIDVQLQKIAGTISTLNKSQRHPPSNQRCFDSMDTRLHGDHDLFRPGDVVFHLVTDQHWDKIDLTSRHPYINGLRNCIRLASKNAVRTLALPLFLNKDVTESQPLAFYQGRADLLLKCIKGFLIEVCSTGASNANCAAFNERSMHYNIIFGVPETLGPKIFEATVDTILQVFHLVPTVNV
ncbi:unnamed protein product [Bursaphelenchus xylophilus]|uniref:(pine wood nematode) hypothetical protein n=1 Tax=Bursaphelenchus xylophilus TaxID=6326 RepID=A0A7I8WWW9_BURXY|nr:unnamed protein product [Bursaphelenchus xylophilus]CAG9099832.1 unnamed protein product [Bursaphelenchus xylophilus]